MKHIAIYCMCCAVLVTGFQASAQTGRIATPSDQIFFYVADASHVQSSLKLIRDANGMVRNFEICDKDSGCYELFSRALNEQEADEFLSRLENLTSTKNLEIDSDAGVLLGLVGAGVGSLAWADRVGYSVEVARQARLYSITKELTEPIRYFTGARVAAATAVIVAAGAATAFLVNDLIANRRVLTKLKTIRSSEGKEARPLRLDSRRWESALSLLRKAALESQIHLRIEVL